MRRDYLVFLDYHSNCNLTWRYFKLSWNTSTLSQSNFWGSSINTFIFNFLFFLVSLAHVRICQSVRWQILFCFFFLVFCLASLWVCIFILHWPLRSQFWKLDEAVRIRFRVFDSQNLTRKKYFWSSVRGLKDKWLVDVFRDWQAACVIGVRALERNSI